MCCCCCCGHSHAHKNRRCASNFPYAGKHCPLLNFLIKTQKKTRKHSNVQCPTAGVIVPIAPRHPDRKYKKKHTYRGFGDISSHGDVFAGLLVGDSHHLFGCHC